MNLRIIWRACTLPGALLSIVLWLAPGAAWASAALLAPEQAAKLPAHVLEKALAGETQNLLILFEDAAIDADIKAHLSRRGLKVEDDAALALRASRYRQLKAPALALLGTLDAEVRKDYVHIPMTSVRFRGSAALIELLGRPEVAAILEDTKLYPILSQSLPLVGQPAVAQVMGRTGAGATVAVLDTGVDYTLAEFGSCTAPGVPSGCRVVAALDTAPDDGARDAHGHGTQVAATAAGIAPGAGIAAIDVFDGGSAFSSDIIAGIEWVIANRSAHNIVAFNLSLGDGVKHTTPCSNKGLNPYRQPFINARSAGILGIVASGNEGFVDGISGPACTPEAVSTGAVYDANSGSVGWGICTDSSTAADKVTCFSDSASFLTLLAPGALITVVGATVGGTSFAAPHAAGAVAVLKATFPAETPDQTQSRLTSSGKPVTDSRNGIITPRLDLLAAQGPPANDNFAAAYAISGNSATPTGWNYNAGKESGEPDHAGVAGGKSAWWQWTAPTDGTLSLDTHGSGFDTLLGVYTGTGVSALTAVASNDNDGTAGNASGLSVVVLSGTVYRIAVDGKSGATGAITLNLAFRLPESDLEITLLDSPDPVTEGSPLTYTLTVINHGPDTAASATATLALDPGTAFGSAGSGCTASASTVTCELGSLANGEMRSLDVIVTPSATGTVSATAKVTGTTQDPVAGNNTASAQTVVEQAPSAAAGDTEVPLLPPWALLLFGSALYGVLSGRGRTSRK